MAKEIKLTHKQKLFVDWYIKLGNGTQAAIKAGYSEKTAQEMASENLSKPMVQAYYKLRMTQLEEVLGFNKATIVQDLIHIKDKCQQAKPVMEWDYSERAKVQQTVITEDGEEVGIYEFDSFGANRAIDTINKMMGYYEPEKIEDVTPTERKQMSVTVKKEYVNGIQPATETNNGMGSSGEGES